MTHDPIETIKAQLRQRRDHYARELASIDGQLSRLDTIQHGPQPTTPSTCAVCGGSGIIETQIVRPDPYTGQLTRYGSTTAECPMRCNPQAVAQTLDKSRQIMLEETKRAIADTKPDPLDFYRP